MFCSKQTLSRGVKWFGVCTSAVLGFAGMERWHLAHFPSAAYSEEPDQREQTPQLPAVRPIPEGPLGDTIRLGEQLVAQTATHPLTKPYVGNALNCTSCHLKNGQDPRAASFLGVAAAYPAWSSREQRVITLEDRVLNCFMRSCNGIRPPLGSQVSVAITSYITWLSQDYGLAMNSERPVGPNSFTKLDIASIKIDLKLGEDLYEGSCSGCHGSDGRGGGDGPPVWGEMSYNDGAGLAKVAELASWLHVAMPPDDTNLTEEEAVQIAAYVNSHPRPVFKLEEHLPEPAKLGEYNSGTR